MKRLLLLAATCCLLAPLSPTLPAAEKDTSDEDAQTLVYFGDTGPVLIKLNLRLDGKSHREAWAAFMDHLFDYLDVKKDGKLTVKQAAAAPPAQVLASSAGFFGVPSGLVLEIP